MTSDDAIDGLPHQVDDPKTEGFGPKRHTSYQVSTQVRRSGVGWIKCRHRFYDFV